MYQASYKYEDCIYPYTISIEPMAHWHGDDDAEQGYPVGCHHVVNGRSSAQHELYLADEAAGFGEDGGADAERAGTAYDGKDAAESVVVMETEAHQQGHRQECCGIRYPSTLDIRAFYGATNAIACQQDGQREDGWSGKAIVIKLGETVAQHTGQPTWLVEIGS